ncbi:membrane protein [Desulfonatronum thiosulfatophilum]|uniref:Membrane protein n=1 Tax=Desulfonatronum thiosulfatophilum TaxID=617002 RepID=A0A1G6AAL8_9BACT|nr:YhjD/YihY/BrkB family envelope integrity protein [Desulfonatronum thiosulfatophilum]SDB05477.1 membrane protein [Desulfonatronum thiosulfatophilum]
MWPRLSLKIPFDKLGDGLNWFLQTTYGTVLQFLKNQLTSHASAAAFYFLLSIGPLILLVISLLNMSLINNPELSDRLFNFLTEFNEELNEDFFRTIGIFESQVAISGLGFLGFLWTSRLIISSIQSAFHVIFPSSRTRNFLWSNLLSMVLVPGVLTLLLLSALFNIIIRFLYNQLQVIIQMEHVYEPLLYLSGWIVPLGLVFGLIFVCYRFLPLAKPNTWHALLGAGLFTLSIHGLRVIFVEFITLASYNYIYGSLGAVIFLLLWVYVIFLLFFLFAQFVEVAGQVDIFALDRIIDPQNGSGGIGNRVETRLFTRSRRIFSKYSRKVRAGEVIYRQGDRHREIFYLYSGRVEYFDESKPDVATHLEDVEPGQFFGETAYLLQHSHIVATRAKEDSELLLVPPHVFESLLAHSPSVSRKVIKSLSLRLKQVATGEQGGVAKPA